MRKNEEDFGKLWELNAVWNFLTPDEKEFIDKHTSVKYYRKNETIYNEGDLTEHVVMVVRGIVRLSKEGVGHRLQIIRLLKPYDTFGYRSAMRTRSRAARRKRRSPCRRRRSPPPPHRNRTKRE